MSDNPERIVRLHRQIGDASAAAAAVLIAREAGFVRPSAAVIVDHLMGVDRALGRGRAKFWRAVVVLLGIKS